jgi:hypothetical protein
MCGLDVAHVRLFFSFTYEGMKYPCALAHWFLHVGESPDENTGMWVVEPDVLDDGTHHAAVIHLDSIFHAAHLIAIYGEEFVLNYLSFTDSLDAFHVYYVNKYIDHHAFK